MAKSKCIIVLGCYRTGSSAVAGILNKLGVHMGERFLPANDNNKYGYFEDQDFVEAHKSQPFLLTRYNDLVSQKAKQPLWGFKDPYLCRIFDRTIPIIREHSDIQFIVCKRSVEGISESLQRAIPEKASWELMINHNTFLIDEFVNSVKEPVLQIHFDALKFSAPKIAEFVNLPLNEAAATHFSNT